MSARFLRLSLVALVGSAVVYAFAWFFSGMGENDPSAAESVLLWAGVIGVGASFLALLGGLITHAMRRS